MKRIIIILWAGSVLCGACSIWGRAEKRKTMAGEMTTVETRSGIRRDSSVGRTDKLVLIDRQWALVLPETGATDRYAERLRVAEAAETLTGTIAQQTQSAHHQQQVETAEYRRTEGRANGWVGWWVAVAMAVAVWVVLRLWRFWPFK